MPLRAIGRHLHDAFEHAPNLRRRQTVVAIAALPHHGEKLPLGELCEMSTRRLRRDTREIGKLARGERPPVQERGENVGACRIADQGGDFGHIETFPHRPQCKARAAEWQGAMLRPRPKHSWRTLRMPMRI